MTHILGKLCVSKSSVTDLGIAVGGTPACHTDANRTGVAFGSDSISFVVDGSTVAILDRAGLTTVQLSAHGLYDKIVDKVVGIKYNPIANRYEVCNNGCDWEALTGQPDLLDPKRGGTGYDLSGVVIDSLVTVTKGGVLQPSKIIDRTDPSGPLALSTTLGTKELHVVTSGIVAVTNKQQTFTEQIFAGSEMVPELSQVCIGGGIVSAGKAIKLVNGGHALTISHETGYVVETDLDIHFKVSGLFINEVVSVIEDSVTIRGSLVTDELLVRGSVMFSDWELGVVGDLCILRHSHSEILYVTDSGFGVGAIPEAKLHVAGGAEPRQPTSREVLISGGMICPGRRTDWADKLADLDPKTVTQEELANYVKLLIEEGRRIGIYG